MYNNYGTLCSGAAATPSCTTTLTDAMPNRFLVPALITGMILTVRVTTSFVTMFARIWAGRVLATPFGPSTR
jgi:hypothetical protein